MKKNPKILIVSHNPLSDTQSNGKTISSILSCFPKESLAQLYFTMDTPDFSICNNFFRITDVDVLKNFFLINNNVGHIIDYTNFRCISKEKKEFHKNLVYSFVRQLFVSKISFMTTLRDFVWRNSEYYSNSFEQWLNEFDPDIVFFQSSNCCFAFEFVREICYRKKIKLVMQTTDDYLSYRVIGLFYNYNVLKLRNLYKMLNEVCILNLPISDKMKNYYSKMFPNSYYVTMNNVVLNDKDVDFKLSRVNINILYAGNLGLNRWKVIYKLAKVIDSLGLNLKIEVYSLDVPSKKIINKLDEFSCCRYCYSLSADDLKLKRESADILLHVESFDYFNKHLTKYSISTKIPEMMNSRKLILAIGPGDLASIEYLKSTNSAIVVDKCDKNNLSKSLKKIVNENDFNIYLENACKCVSSNHNIVKAQKYIKDIIERSVDNDENKANNS